MTANRSAAAWCSEEADTRGLPSQHLADTKQRPPDLVLVAKLVRGPARQSRHPVLHQPARRDGSRRSRRQHRLSQQHVGSRAYPIALTGDRAPASRRWQCARRWSALRRQAPSDARRARSSACCTASRSLRSRCCSAQPPLMTPPATCSPTPLRAHATASASTARNRRASSRQHAGREQLPLGTSHGHRPAAVNTSGSRRLLPRLPAVYLEESREPRARKARRSEGTLTHCRQASGHYGTVAAQTEGRKFGPTCRRLRSPHSRGRLLPPPHGRVCRSERTVAVAVSL